MERRDVINFLRIKGTGFVAGSAARMPGCGCSANGMCYPCYEREVDAWLEITKSHEGEKGGQPTG
jgi:hypothetical protein